ncbi:MAG: hypothetical protein AB8B63_04415 [Granulosicoccus sp.]
MKTIVSLIAGLALSVSAYPRGIKKDIVDTAVEAPFTVFAPSDDAFTP